MIKAIIQIVRQASSIVTEANFDIEQKDGYANIVTTSDRAVQDYLCEHLAALLPGSGFLCEEEDMWDTSHEYTWIIDPIDGTQNFSRGIRECAICVGLKKDAEMHMGVVYLPHTDQLFHAVRGEGAFLNGKPIHVSNRPFANGILCTALPVYHKENTDICARIIQKAFLECNDIRRFGAAAPEICYLAMGHCELYFEFQLCPWDFAAASLILQEAGGVISDLKGNPLTCTEKSGVFAANNQENLERLVAIGNRE